MTILGFRVKSESWLSAFCSLFAYLGPSAAFMIPRETIEGGDFEAFFEDFRGWLGKPWHSPERTATRSKIISSNS